MLPALAGVVLLQNLDDRTSAARIFSAGWLIGLAVLMKQSGAAFGLFAAGWILWCEFSSGQKSWLRLATRLGWLALGGLLPFFLMCFIIVRAGDFRQFWFWTFQYAGQHGTIFTLGHGIQWMFSNLGRQFLAAPGLWGAAVLGLVLLFGESGLATLAVFHRQLFLLFVPVGLSGMVFPRTLFHSIDAGGGVAGGRGVPRRFRFFCPARLSVATGGLARPDSGRGRRQFADSME